MSIFSRNNGICQLTKEVSEYPTKYIGSRCPLNFSGEINEITKKLDKSLKLLSVQLEGSKRMDVDSFLRGKKIEQEFLGK